MLNSRRHFDLTSLVVIGITLSLFILAGFDPAHGFGAAVLRGRSVSANNQASYEWNRNNERLDSQVFTTEILPLIQEVPLSAMVDATGLSKGYCSFIKRGIKVPHERHWSAFKHLGS